MKKITYILCLLIAVGSVNMGVSAADSAFKDDPFEKALNEEKEAVFQNLKGIWKGTKVTLQAENKSGDKYIGHIELKNEKMNFSGIVKNGVFEGEIELSDGNKRSFTLKSKEKNLIFQTGSFTDELELKSMVKENFTITLNDDVKLDMIWIERGSFTMGSPNNELGRIIFVSGENQHPVTLTKSYWLGKYEVTQAQYKAVMNSTPSEFKGTDLPVEKVSWYDAKEFCEKLTEIEKSAGRLPEGYEYTLPTEAQWEYACRAGTMTALNSGKNLTSDKKCHNLDELAWYESNSNSTTHPVGQKKPNAWGLYDMHGNVWEWCLDWHGDYPTMPVNDPRGPMKGSDRVLRGGSWMNGSNACRSAMRVYYCPPSETGYHIGFRIALSPIY